MSNAKKQNKILIILVLTVCAVALAVSVVTPVSGAKYVKTLPDNSVTIKVTQIPTTTRNELSEGIEFLLNEFFRNYNPNNNENPIQGNGSGKYFHEWSYLYYWLIINQKMATGKTLDSTGGNWGRRITQQIMNNTNDGAIDKVMLDPDLSFCIATEIVKNEKTVSIYFVNKYINSLAVSNRVDNVYKLTFTYTGGKNGTFALSQISTTFEIGTMELESKYLETKLMTYLKNNTFVSTQSKKLTAVQGTKSYTYTYTESGKPPVVTTITPTYYTLYENPTAQAGQIVNQPADLVAPEGFTFDGWYADEALTTPFVFGNTATEDITLYPKFTAVA